MLGHPPRSPSPGGRGACPGLDPGAGVRGPTSPACVERLSRAVQGLSGDMRPLTPSLSLLRERGSDHGSP